MSKNVTHHLKTVEGDVGRYVFLPGDPGRVKKIAEHLDNAVHVKTYREYVTYTGTLEGEKVSVVSTGIGGPSAAIAMEELAQIGADTFIRIGTCGGIDSSLLPGDLVIPTGAIRKDGTGQEYVPIEYPAVPDFGLVRELADAAERLKNRHHLGVVECKDSYYGQHDPERMPVSFELNQKWEAWKKAGALASEMESATLYIVATTLRVRCATVLLLCRNREREALLNTEVEGVWETKPAIETGIEAIRSLIQREKRIG